MKYELYINQVLFSVTESCNQAFAWFKEWTGQGYDVRLKFVRTGLSKGPS